MNTALIRRNLNLIAKSVENIERSLDSAGNIRIIPRRQTSQGSILEEFFRGAKKSRRPKKSKRSRKNTKKRSRSRRK